jgi:hypothetical protein
LTARGATKLPLQGRIVKAMFHTRTDRGMQLIEFQSRCIARGELHELVSTDQQGLRAGDRVDRVGFLGFMEAQNAGVIERGDRFIVAGTCWGTVAGFDECHYPNHYNVLITTETLLTAAELPAFGPGTPVSFEEPQ